MKYLIWFLICLAVVTWIKRKKAAFFNMNHQGPRTSSGEPTIETMQQCARCGMHIPASEAITDGSGTVFCCQEHRVQYAPR
jgi:uncharacterized protein